MLFYLTNTVLEITWGATWWVTTKAASGLYSGVSYLLYGDQELTEEQIKEIQVIEFDDESKTNENYVLLMDEIKNLNSKIKKIKEKKN